MEKVAVGDEVDGLKNVLNEIMNFQYENFQLSRFVWREISIDSQIVRETMTTYFRKERHLFQTFIERGIQNQVFKNIPISITIIQLKGILTMPFLNSIYVSEVWNIYFQEIYYLDQYKKQLEYWVDNFLCVASGANLENK